MELNLDRDLIFFDIESTGLNVITDRIVQLAMIKYPKGGGAPVEYNQLINPGIPISEESMAVHGITPEMLRNKPSFLQVHEAVLDFIGKGDLAGYNSNRFDVPLLLEEFARCGVDFDLSRRRTIDIQRIFYKMEPRTLRAAYKFYCDKNLEGAHDALADVRATAEVLMGQLNVYHGVDLIDEEGGVTPHPVRNDMQALHEFTNDLRVIDATQKLRMDHNGVIVFNFGKYMHQPVGEVMFKDQQYYQWILNKEFSYQVKTLVKKEFKAYEKSISK
jgi:DNA polymerase-3 subunit epsilon